MAKNFSTIEECIGYATAPDKINTDPRYLVAGSQNVLIDRKRKIQTRNGIKRLGGGSTTANAIKNQDTWTTSTGQRWMMRAYDDELEVWISTLDGVDVNAWTRVADSWDTDEIIRWVFGIWKDSETLDIMLFVQGDSNLYEWNGAVAVVSSDDEGAGTITKKGTTTFGQNRFFTTANQTLVCARTGTEYTYTGGEGTTTLTGVATSGTWDLQEDDILVQKVVTHTNEPASSRNNHTIGSFENHVLIGSQDDNEVYMTANNDFTDTTFSAPRVSGEGALFTLDGPSRGFGKAGRALMLFAGNDSLFRVVPREVAVSTTLAEVLDVKKITAGSNQGCMSADMIIQLENAIIYLSNEPALRYVQDPEEIGGTNPRTLSNPIKPDFDDETWDNGHMKWYRNAVYLTSPTNSKLYILEFVQDADGKLRRFWQPPQILPVRALSELNGLLYAGSNAVQETYELFNSDAFSDMEPNGTFGDPDNKIPYTKTAVRSYNTYGDRVRLKTFDEYFNEGEIRTNTTLNVIYDYEFAGVLQSLTRTIDGSDDEITEQTVIDASLGQESLGVNPLGGLLSAPSDALYFSIIHEIAREDFRKMQVTYTSGDVDEYWSILSGGPNVEISRRRNINIKK